MLALNSASTQISGWHAPIGLGQARIHSADADAQFLGDLPYAHSALIEARGGGQFFGALQLLSLGQAGVGGVFLAGVVVLVDPAQRLVCGVGRGRDLRRVERSSYRRAPRPEAPGTGNAIGKTDGLFRCDWPGFHDG